MSFWIAVKQIMREAQLILIVADARMPEESMNKELCDYAEKSGKAVFFVFNKIDLVSEQALRDLQSKWRKAFFVSGSKNIGISAMKRQLLIAGKRNGYTEPKLGVFGYPNVGKSSIINALAHRARAVVTPIAGTTKGPQFVRAGGLKIIDSPGVIHFIDGETKLGMIAAKNPEKLKHPDRVVYDIIKRLKESNKEALEKYANTKIDGLDDYEIITAIGKRKGNLKKGGVIDERKTVISIIQDWQKGKILVK